MRTLLLFAALMSASSAQAAGEADLDMLVEMFTGSFDSAEQYRMEVDAGLPEDERHPRTVLQHTPIAAPSIGRHAFYVQESRGEPAKLVRKRIVTFDVDRDADAIRMKFFALKNQEGVSPTADNVTLLTGCDILLTVESGVFEGSLAGKTCAVPETDKEARYVQTTLTVAQNQIMRVERMFYADDGAPTDPRADASLPTVHFKSPY